MSPATGIESAIRVAVGGRGTLLVPVVGAAIVNGAKSFFTQSFPEYWLFFLGLLFILVTLFLPKGVVGFVAALRRRAAPSPAVPAGLEKEDALTLPSVQPSEGAALRSGA
jgi:hypothetical protein